MAEHTINPQKDEWFSSTVNGKPAWQKWIDGKLYTLFYDPKAGGVGNVYTQDGQFAYTATVVGVGGGSGGTASNAVDDTGKRQSLLAKLKLKKQKKSVDQTPDPAPLAAAAASGGSSVTTPSQPVPPVKKMITIGDNDGHSYSIPETDAHNYKISQYGDLLEKKADGSGWYIQQKAAAPTGGGSSNFYTDNSDPSGRTTLASKPHGAVGVNRSAAFGGDGSDVVLAPQPNSAGSTATVNDTYDVGGVMYRNGQPLTGSSNAQTTTVSAASVGSSADPAGTDPMALVSGTYTPINSTQTASGAAAADPASTDPMAIVSGTYTPPSSTATGSGGAATTPDTSDVVSRFTANHMTDPAPAATDTSDVVSRFVANNGAAADSQSQQLVPTTPAQAAQTYAQEHPDIPAWHTDVTKDLDGIGGAAISDHGTALATRASKDGSHMITQMSDGTYQSVDMNSGSVSGAGTWGSGHGEGVAQNGIGNGVAYTPPVPPRSTDVSATSGFSALGVDGNVKSPGNRGRMLEL